MHKKGRCHYAVVTVVFINFVCRTAVQADDILLPLKRIQEFEEHGFVLERARTPGRQPTTSLRGATRHFRVTSAGRNNRTESRASVHH